MARQGEKERERETRSLSCDGLCSDQGTTGIWQVAATLMLISMAAYLFRGLMLQIPGTVQPSTWRLKPTVGPSQA